ncbi:hypothetical protein N7492_000348 [Penicillium capsulatum]|uniref:Uncharacterized protein n=1 Tax=Penicillium capsulatum TaxID=69766 RepID=A0A9W9IRK6_9EURO|nr:hypothetical protein N7492_000348 [Penicillium capsulatum]KAJ6130588.1 hypothetical protein N7512_003368 [Penicillium capsulatum]
MPLDIQSVLLSKTWFGFDLDDTLHEFRKASAQASHTVFEAIQAEFGVHVNTLKTHYRAILRDATADAFTDGRTSTEYRRERFTRLLETQGLARDGSIGEFVDSLLEVYQFSLRSNLALKQGVLSLLQTLRRLGKSVIVVTEGPDDSQRWTVRELGLEPYIDVLVTTNEIGTAKPDGLFAVVLERFGISADDMVYFGDNEVRDIQAARKAGILSIFYAEHQGCLLQSVESIQIDSWPTLQDILMAGR